MLQSPPSIYHDSGFRLQTLMHGRNYLSPIQGGTSVPQHPGGSVPPVDSSPYRGFICHPSSHHRLPHFPLSIPPVDILPQYQPHHAGGLGQVGYPPPGLLPSGRAGHLPPSALDSYSQTLFQLSQQQVHVSPQTLVAHQDGGGTPVVQQVARQTAGGKGADGTVGAIGGTRDGDDGSDRFPPLFGMIGYLKPPPFDGRFSDKNSAEDLSMKPSGVPGYRLLRHSQTTLKQQQQQQHSDDSSTSPFCHSQCQPPQRHHHLPKSGNTRVHGADETQRNNNNNNNSNNNNNNNIDCNGGGGGGSSGVPNRKEYFIVDRFKDEIGSCPWRSTMPCSVYPEVDFSSFKDPNSIGVHQPSDPRIYPRNGFVNYPSNATSAVSASSSSSSSSSLSPSGVNYGTRSSPLTSASHVLSHSAAAASLHRPASSSDRSRPVAYRRHFSKGSVIQLASGRLKRVEELTTEDFLDSRRARDDLLSVNTSRVTHVRLNHDNEMAVIGFAVGQKQIQVSVEAAVEHPFFVFNRGWSSCNPSKTLDHYGLPCHQLAIGDTCISLTHRYPDSPAAAAAAEAAPSSSQPPADEECPLPSPPKSRKSSKGYKMSPPCCCSNQSPEEPQMVPGGAVAEPPRCDDDDDGSQVVVSPEPRPGRTDGQQRAGRKRRWSAPDNGGSSTERRTLTESPPVVVYDPLEIDRNAQSPVILNVAS